jgi:hypothetical protein
VVHLSHVEERPFYGRVCTILATGLSPRKHLMGQPNMNAKVSLNYFVREET